MTFTINSPVFDDDGDMDDPITLGGNGATLTVNGPASWAMRGTLTTNPAGRRHRHHRRHLADGPQLGRRLFNANGNTTVSAPITFGTSSTTTVAAPAVPHGQRRRDL